MEENELTIKDVMCGDWVDVRNDVAPNKSHYEQITPAHLLRDEHWYGIELKRVHLTKNGFKATDEADDEFVYNDGYEIKVMFDRGAPVFNIEPFIILRITFAEKELYMPIEYIHEMQQGMKLFGIRKEIKL